MTEETMATATADEDIVYLIWSFEQDRWWVPSRHGYTRNIELAGHFSHAAPVRSAPRKRAGINFVPHQGCARGEEGGGCETR
jgi:hypothetical protein